jgi:signal transduction histidine kinase
MLTAAACWIVVAWCAALLAVYLYTTYSQTSIWDDRLQSVAVKLAELGPRTFSAGSVETSAIARNNELTFQIWTDAGERLASTPRAPNTPLLATFTDGFANVSIDGQQWRVYSVSDRQGKIHVQVGHPRATINADFQKHSLKAVSLAAIPLAISGLLLWWAVSRALQPLARMEATVRERSMFDLQPLTIDGLPTELLPLVLAFNQLLVRLDEAVQSERRFIGDAAHELRTPLAALQAQLEVAMRAVTLEEKNAALAKLQLAVRRSSRLSEQLLDLARLEAGARAPRREWQALDEIAQHVAHEFEVVAHLEQRRIEFALTSCRLYCDIDEVGMLIRNLLDNALRYTSSGGRVVMRCGYLDSENGRATFVEVADDGPGVPVNERSAIFERFHRVAGASKPRGSGIGLSLVARIAKLHGARIEVDDGIGQPGLRVRVIFADAYPVLNNS